MQSLRLLTILSICSVLGCNIHISGTGFGTPGSGTVISESRTLPLFDQVEYAGSGEIRISQGELTEVTVTCDDNLLPFITTEVDGNVLRIKTTQGISPSNELSFAIVCPELHRLQLGGSGPAIVEPQECKSLDVGLTGSGSARLEHVKADSLTVNATGSGSIAGAGQVGTINASVTGSGSISIQEMQAQTVQANVMGSGGMQVYASESFQGSSTGSGSIVVYGNPTSKQANTLGSGTIHYHN